MSVLPSLPDLFHAGHLDEEGRLVTPWSRLTVTLRPTKAQLFEPEVVCVRASVRHPRPDVELPRDWRLTATWTPEQPRPLELAVLRQPGSQVLFELTRSLVTDSKHRVAQVAASAVLRLDRPQDTLVFQLGGVPLDGQAWAVEVSQETPEPSPFESQTAPDLVKVPAAEAAQVQVPQRAWSGRLLWSVWHHPRYSARHRNGWHARYPDLPYRPDVWSDAGRVTVPLHVHLAAWASAGPAQGSVRAWERLVSVARLVLGYTSNQTPDVRLLAMALGLRAGLAPYHHHAHPLGAARFGCKARFPGYFAYADCGNDVDGAAALQVAAHELEQLRPEGDAPAGSVAALQRLLSAYLVGVLDGVRSGQPHAMPVLLRRGHVAAGLARFYQRHWTGQAAPDAEVELEEDRGLYHFLRHKHGYLGLEEVDAQLPPVVLLETTEPRLPQVGLREFSPPSQLPSPHPGVVTFEPFPLRQASVVFTSLYVPELTVRWGVHSLNLLHPTKDSLVVGLTLAELLGAENFRLAVDSASSLDLAIFQHLDTFIPPEPLLHDPRAPDLPLALVKPGSRVVFCHPTAAELKQLRLPANTLTFEWNHHVVLVLAHN